VLTTFVADDARTDSSTDGFTPAARGRLHDIDFVFVRRLPGFLLDACNGGGIGGSTGRLEKPAGQSSDPPPPAHRAPSGVNDM